MSEFDAKMQKISDIKDLTKSKARELLTELYPFFVAVASIIFTVVSQLFVYGFDNPLKNPSFWISLARNILTTSAAYVVFVKHGNAMYKITNTAYLENLKVWGEMSAKIRSTSPSSFIEHCREYAKKAVEEKRRAILENNSLMKWEDFNEKFRRMPEAQVEKMRTDGFISRSDEIAIIKAQKPIKPYKIDPVAILCGSDAVKIESLSAQRISNSLVAIIIRPFSMLLVNVGIALMTSASITMKTDTIVFDVVASSFMIMTSCIMGDISGDSAAKKDHAAIKSKIFFIDEYLQK